MLYFRIKSYSVNVISNVGFEMTLFEIHSLQLRYTLTGKSDFFHYCFRFKIGIKECSSLKLPPLFIY